MTDARTLQSIAGLRALVQDIADLETAIKDYAYLGARLSPLLQGIIAAYRFHDRDRAAALVDEARELGQWVAEGGINDPVGHWDGILEAVEVLLISYAEGWDEQDRAGHLTSA